VAIPYFVFLVDYPNVDNPTDKVRLLVDHHTSMYWMHVVSFELTALALIVVTLALYVRLRERSPLAIQVATAVGLIRAGLLLASVMVFNVGMGAVVDLYPDAPREAVSSWQSLEAVANGLGGSGGELLGGIWFLLVNAAALRAHALPRALTWLGTAIGAAGIASLAPALSDLEAGFELLQIVWFAWLGIVMMRPGSTPSAGRPAAS
jgi:hypothetical protein